MRVLAYSIGAVVAVGAASMAVACFGNPDDPIATARFVAAPHVSPPLSIADAQAQVAATSAFPDAQPRRVDVADEDVRAKLDTVGDRLTGLAAYAPPHPVQAMAFTAPPTTLSRLVQDRNLRRGFGEMQAIGDKARLFLFAGDRGGVWTYSFTRDQAGVKAAGWATERADGFGDRRVGLAWQKGRARVALSGVERDLSRFGVELKDRVVALSLSFSPGSADRRDHQRT